MRHAASVYIKVLDFTAPTDRDSVIYYDVTVANRAITLPAANAVGPRLAQRVTIIRTDSSGNSLTATATGGDTLTGTATIAGPGMAEWVSNGIDTWTRII